MLNIYTNKAKKEMNYSMFMTLILLLLSSTLSAI